MEQVTFGRVRKVATVHIYEQVRVEWRRYQATSDDFTSGEPRTAPLLHEKIDQALTRLVDRINAELTTIYETLIAAEKP